MKFTKTTICFNVYNPVFDRWERYVFVFESVANERIRLWRITETRGAGHGIAKSIKEDHSGHYCISAKESLRELLLKKFIMILRNAVFTSWRALPRQERRRRLERQRDIAVKERHLRRQPYEVWISISQTSRPAPCVA